LNKAACRDIVPAGSFAFWHCPKRKEGRAGMKKVQKILLQFLGGK
jgi:hypothetical protein